MFDAQDRKNKITGSAGGFDCPTAALSGGVASSRRSNVRAAGRCHYCRPTTAGRPSVLRPDGKSRFAGRPEVAPAPGVGPTDAPVFGVSGDPGRAVDPEPGCPARGREYRRSAVCSSGADRQIYIRVTAK